MYDIDLDLLSEARCELLALKHKTDFFYFKIFINKDFFKISEKGLFVGKTLREETKKSPSFLLNAYI